MSKVKKKKKIRSPRKGKRFLTTKCKKEIFTTNRKTLCQMTLYRQLNRLTTEKNQVWIF
jgi:hypothetical protein